MKEVKLPSGAILKISHVDFDDSWALYQAVCEEMQETEFTSEVEMATLVKDIVLKSFASSKICQCVRQCFKRCTYNDVKISNDTFEPDSAREDYLVVFTEVMEYAVGPFMKNLYAVYSRTLAALTKSPR